MDEKGEAHSMLHDRAVDYPIRIDRYPEASTVANPAQLGGVIMGRLVAAQRTCSRLDLFQDAVAGIMTHAHNRHYPRRLMHSVWTRFLTRYWDAASVTNKELRAWFHKAWNQVVAAAAQTNPGNQSPLREQEQGTMATPRVSLHTFQTRNSGWQRAKVVQAETRQHTTRVPRLQETKAVHQLADQHVSRSPGNN